MNTQSELKVVAHGDLPTINEAKEIPDPSEEEALFRIVANTKTVEIKTDELSPQLDRTGSHEGNG